MPKGCLVPDNQSRVELSLRSTFNLLHNKNLFSVHWVSESRPGQVVSRGPSLTLSDVSPDISGGYRCVASNTLGESHQTLTINVLCKISIMST